MRRRGAERRESRDETRTLRERSGEATRTRRTTCAPREDVCARRGFELFSNNVIGPRARARACRARRYSSLQNHYKTSSDNLPRLHEDAGGEHIGESARARDRRALTSGRSSRRRRLEGGQRRSVRRRADESICGIASGWGWKDQTNEAVASF